MNMYEVEEGGATHRILAHTKSQVFALWMSYNRASGGGWPEEAPSISIMEREQDFTYEFDSGKKVTLEVWEWCDLISEPQFFATTER